MRPFSICNSDSGGVSGPSDSGSRSTGEDTGEGQLVNVKCNSSWYFDVYNNMCNYYKSYTLATTQSSERIIIQVEKIISMK